MMPDFQKYADGLVPAVVQDPGTHRVLMVGFMNSDALKMTHETGLITFYSRSKKRLWTKGETSGNLLELVSISIDCDSDTLLVLARPSGPVCHTGSETCFGESDEDFSGPLEFLQQLESTIKDRRASQPEGSYIAGLLNGGINRVAQKLGEEAVETVIAAKDPDKPAFVSEAADLLFHYLILLNEKDSSLAEVTEELHRRHK